MDNSEHSKDDFNGNEKESKSEKSDVLAKLPFKESWADNNISLHSNGEHASNTSTPSNDYYDEKLDSDSFARTRNTLSTFQNTQPKPLSVSEEIEATETLEDFEEQERQIAQQLSKKNPDLDISKDLFVPESLQNRQSLDVRQISLPTDSEECDFQEGFSLNHYNVPPPYYDFEVANQAVSKSTAMTSDTQPDVSDNGNRYEMPLPYYLKKNIDYNDTSNNLQKSDNTQNNVKSAIGSSFAFAGGVTAMIAGSSTALKNLSQNTNYSNMTQNNSKQDNEKLSQLYNNTDSDHQEAEQFELNADKTEFKAAHLTTFPITPDLKLIFQNITDYSPETIEIQPILKPFLLDFIPAVGDVDPFLKVPKIDQTDDYLGLMVLDEPSLTQSDSAMIDFQLHQMSKPGSTADYPVKKISEVDKNQHQIDKWIETTREVRKTKPLDRVTYTSGPMPDIEHLMKEWPTEIENLLKNTTLPSSRLDIPLEEYTDLCLAFADIPVYNNQRIEALHLLFSLYSEFKNSQHFRNLEANNIYDTGMPTNTSHKRKENNRLEL